MSGRALMDAIGAAFVVERATFRAGIPGKRTEDAMARVVRDWFDG